MSKHLVLVGGGHAHMLTLANLGRFIANGHRVSVVGPSAHHYYSGMGPGLLGDFYSADDIRFDTRTVTEKQGGRFVADRCVGIDPEKRRLRLASGAGLDYDVVSFNAGSYVPTDIVAGNATDVFTVKPIEGLLRMRRRIQERTAEGETTVAIIGGGAAAAEVAGNIWRLTLQPGGHPAKIRIFAGQAFLSRFPRKVRETVRRSLTERGVDILEHRFVRRVQRGCVELDSGESAGADLIVLALGVRPSPIFQSSGLPTDPDGGLLVNRYLQSPRYPDIFGGGDCIHFQERPLAKVGVYAVRQNPVLFHNLGAALAGRPLRAFDPGGDYLLIFNLGDGTGVLHKGWLTLKGRTAFALKDFIDRRFMRRFQAAESTDR